MDFDYVKGRFGLFAESCTDIFLCNGPPFVLGEDAVKLYLIRTPANYHVHLNYSFESSKAGEIVLYKDCVITTPGSSCDIINNNDNCTDTAETLIYEDSTYSDIGEEVTSAIIGSDAPSVNHALGGQYESKIARILDKDADYLLAFKSSGIDNTVSHLIAFIEEC